MERNICINWSVIVEEAHLRRKQLGFTQERLGILAGVGTPTVSHFENGHQNILLSSAMSILGVLGMLDSRNLTFDTNRAFYEPYRMVVICSAVSREAEVLCAISLEALSDHFGVEIKEGVVSSNIYVKEFLANKSKICHAMEKKFLAGSFEADGSILIKTEDL